MEKASGGGHSVRFQPVNDFTAMDDGGRMKVNHFGAEFRPN